MSGIRRIVLLGFMGAGKSTVGPLLAERLGWRYLDLDAWIEAQAGRSVAEIFQQSGEPRFREWEVRATEELVGCEGVVLSPGGGWITNPGIAGRLGPGTLLVWLQVSAEVAVARVGAQRGTRPLLDVDDPVAAAARLLAAREALYSQADLHLPTADRTPDRVVDEIERHVRAGPSGRTNQGPEWQ